MPTVDFSEFDPKLHNGAATGNIVFIKGKNTQPIPLTVRPVGPVQIMTDFVFDADIKRNRKARMGEKTRTQYLFNGVDAEGDVKTFVAGSQVISGIKECREIRESEDIYLEISSTGSLLDTKYAVRPSKNKKLNGKVDIATLELPDLGAIAESLVVDVPLPPDPLAIIAKSTGKKIVAKGDVAFAE